MVLNYTNEKEHLEVMDVVLKEIFKTRDKFNPVLKGGTALLFCYGLKRFSEDIDLDAYKINIENTLRRLCERKGWGFRVYKDTLIVKRYFIDYSSKAFLKVEVSYRSPMKKETVTWVNGINTYTVSKMLDTKIDALLQQNRNKVRDIYDICHIVYEYENLLEEEDFYSLARMYSYDNESMILDKLISHTDEIIPKKDEQWMLQMLDYIKDLIEIELSKDLKDQ